MMAISFKKLKSYSTGRDNVTVKLEGLEGLELTSQRHSHRGLIVKSLETRMRSGELWEFLKLEVQP